STNPIKEAITTVCVCEFTIAPDEKERNRPGEDAVASPPHRPLHREPHPTACLGPPRTHTPAAPPPPTHIPSQRHRRPRRGRARGDRRTGRRRRCGRSGARAAPSARLSH